MILGLTFRVLIPSALKFKIQSISTKKGHQRFGMISQPI